MRSAADEARRARARTAQLAGQVAELRSRLDQVEANTARIDRLEARLAEVVAALPQLDKGPDHG
jgi:hypothetical protein